VTFRADELEEPISDMRGGAVNHHGGTYGPLGGSSETARSGSVRPNDIRR